MSIIFTNHALQRCKDRDIFIDDILDCINNPDHIAEDKEIKCYKKIGIDKYLLMTYTKDDNDDIILITVIKTSKIIKYL